MKDALRAWRERALEGARSFGLTRWIILGFLVMIWLVAALATERNLGTLLGDCLVRTGMNGVMVLALVLPVRAGNGLNFGLPLGIVCGLLGGVFVMEMASPNPFGLWTNEANAEFARGWSGFWLAHLVALPFALVAGWGFGWILERVRGQEMMVGIYVGFGAVAGMCLIWLLGPWTSPEMVWALAEKGGPRGLRNTFPLDEHYRWILDSWGEVRFGSEPAGGAIPFRRPAGLYVPTGLLVYWLGACAVVGLFLRTKLGVALTAAGSNPEYARAIGIPVSRMRILSMVFSTVLAAFGILAFSQSYGFYQLYKAPLFMGFMMVAALLLGGASLQRATILHVIVGTFLFQSLLTTSIPVVNDLVKDSDFSVLLEDLPEIARLVIQNGVILYALTRIRGGQ